ncbi:hypothetical protein TcG_13082 [Trypanosoma cruzi]|nr:hypothetical protein TcG_13082 [Trypanosoma cruzi]
MFIVLVQPIIQFVLFLLFAGKSAAIDVFISSFVAVAPDSPPFIAVEMKICEWTPTHQNAPSLLFIAARKGMCVWWCLVHIFLWAYIPLQAEGGTTLRRGALPSHAAHCDSSCITLSHTPWCHTVDIIAAAVTPRISRIWLCHNTSARVAAAYKQRRPTP